ncbi:probable disease resistance protein At5g63020 isoform X2 [Punica granatum]|uniref:Probable disease resistance protein At5g63020 isoform X2 n=1 Tax=Punica granatum TaxID=22663 RepID=A0A6P8BR57_PUNGR|nr:probable disease resistance protein At5g63020 isoform X2 [Punica granatum]
MADFAKTVFDTGLTCWDRTAKYRKYIRSLGDNLTALEIKTDELGSVYNDVNRLAETAEGEGWIRKSDAAGWLDRVKALREEADEILADGKQIMGRICLCGLCYRNCRSRYEQSKLAEAKKAELETELLQGRNFRVKYDVAYEPADLILERSLQALRYKMDELCGVFETVKKRVKREEDQHLVRTPEVRGWLERVKLVLEKEVGEILERGTLELGKSCKKGGGDFHSQRNFTSISRSADEKRVILEGLLGECRGFTELTCKPDDPLMVEITLEPPVGMNSMFQEVWNWVEDESVRCVGIFGMGGVGKTTLLNRVHNQFLQVSHDYNFVLRVVVSRPVNLENLQKAIWEKLKLPEDEWDPSDKESTTSAILKSMKDKNFLLFMDDLWDAIDLLIDLGIPCHDHQNKCKIIFTTRSVEVCNRMKVDKRKKVECLPPNDALQLFRQKLGEKTWISHPGIPEIAHTLVHECKYLPLALITVARAMAGTMDLEDWMNAEKDLKRQVSKFTDMEEEVLKKLEFSYNRLPDEIHKRCFLYLSIFPEDHEIYEDDAIVLWIGEGFLDECDDVHEARTYGRKVFRKLRHACLVESVRQSTPLGEIVKMHDFVREMCLWVYSEHGSKKKKVFVQEEVESFRMEDLKKWKDAERISLWRVESSVDDTSLATISCSRLSTLIIRDTNLRTIPDELFLSMPCLRVLDLSDNYNLQELPDSIWKLINLRYLNLDRAEGKTHEVPVEIKNMSNLVVLILSRNFLVSAEVISNLSSLRLFYWSNVSKYWWKFESSAKFCEIELLEVLQMMQSVEEIDITLITAEGVEKLQSCPKLTSHVREINVGTGEYEGSYESPGRYSSNVESHAPKPASFASRDSFQGLRYVTIRRCKDLENVTSLIYHAPFLENLHIEGCGSMKELIVEDIEDNHVTSNRVFPWLASLRLDYLTNLERICRRTLPFPALKEIIVRECPKLKELPMTRDSAKNSLQVIEGEQEWWEGLKWDDPASKQVFSTKFVSCSDAMI